ncbi:PAS domain-containing protein [Desulfobacter curvatus]|uniref:PAS domain-containing protein n=1 Tax=Desulfobacter curvatus TaxID=2290 RepID=UPI00037C05E5|nr:PAS domain-containing protein [Desulfobacter curvatus]
MNTKDNQLDGNVELRCKAEKKIKQEAKLLSNDLTAALSREEIGQLIHELEVHKIELEMQNDELRLAQEELERSHKRYLDLYDFAPVGYCVINEKGLVLKANLTAATLLGQTRSDLINRPISLFILSRDYYIFNHHWKILFETGKPQTFELRMLRNGKSLFCARLDSVVAENGGEPPVVCQITITDICESKRIEYALKKRVKELNLLFRFSDLLEKPDIGLDEVMEKMVLLIPQAWQFPEITEACIDLEGQIFQTKDFRKTQWMQTSDIVIQKKKIGQVMVCYTENRPEFNGELFSIEEVCLLNAMTERLGHIIERVRMTEAISQNEMFLRTTINSITKPFAVINAMDYTVELANEAYGGEKMVGLKCHEILFQRGTPCTGDDYTCPVQEVKRTGKPFVGEQLYHDEQGNPLNIETYAFPVLDQNGRIAQIIKYQIDITARIQTELELQQKANELEDMNAALKVLLKRRELDKDEIEKNIFANYQMLLTPIIQNLKNTLTQEDQEEIVKILELSLKHILSPFSKKLSDKLINLTPTEIHVAQLIKSGKSNKEISQILNCSFHTVSRHRDNIRAKTGLKNKKINLRSFLLSLE